MKVKKSVPRKKPVKKKCCPVGVVEPGGENAPPVVPDCPAGNGTTVLKCVRTAAGCTLEWGPA